MNFSNLKLIEPLMNAVHEEGYTNPTPIQQQSIPVILERKDLLGCAQTGTGKTAAFAIPLLQLLNDQQPTNRRAIRALVLTPTRELAIQVEESFRTYGRYLRLRHGLVFGGVSQHAQVHMLRQGIDTLVATPGRLIDLINQGLVSLSSIEYLVLDEADRMLDMGFVHDVKRIIAKLPTQRQTLFFSATMPPAIQQLANALLKNPVKVQVNPVSSTAQTIQQQLYYVNAADKPALLAHLLNDSAIKTALVFARTKYGADKIARRLSKEGIRAEAIHGNKSQGARQQALQLFKSQSIRVLVATDIAARGIDIDELAHVINYELPNVPETYVHRIGRTGRAGASGIAISFCDGSERPFLADIQKLIGKKIEVATAPAFMPKPIVAEKPAVIASPANRQQRHSQGHSRKYGNRDRRAVSH